MQNKERTYYRQLLQHYLNGTLDRDEVEELFEYIAGNEGDQEYFFDEVDFEAFNKKLVQNSKPPKDAGIRMFRRFQAGINGENVIENKKSSPHSFFIYLLNGHWRIASVLLLLIAGGYFWFRQPSAKTPTPDLVQTVITPGGNRAVLTLSNGTKVNLDSLPSGQTIMQGKSHAMNVHNGLLTYTAINSQWQSGNKITYNTLTTPRGGQYKLILSDGTKVWLNAASSIRYPTIFSQNERRVEITGEAYFEIEKNANKPFRVVTDKATVEVLGTHFDLRAYPDGTSVETTLLKGAVRVYYDNQSVVLNPGQQAKLHRNSTAIDVLQVDTSMAVAWKNGEFSFSNTDIYEVMRQLSRWYDVDVHYRDSVTVLLNGHIKRDVEVTKVFKILALTKEVNFHISGRNIEVSK